MGVHCLKKGLGQKKRRVKYLTDGGGGGGGDTPMHTMGKVKRKSFSMECQKCNWCGWY